MSLQDIPYIYVADTDESSSNNSEEDIIHKIMNYKFNIQQIAYVFAGLMAFQLIWNIIVYIYHSIRNYCLVRKAREYRRKRDEQLKSFLIPTPNVDKDIIQKVLNEDVTSIKKLLSKGKVSSEDLVNIFAKRSQQYGAEYEIITHLKYEEAIRQAKECDKLRKEKSPLAQGLLFGIPVSVKENYDEKGYPSTLGCIQRLNNVPVNDGFIISLLKKSGAIPFLRTNVPQCCFTFESYNRIYGRVQNPWNRTKMAGGSSGGEGAAIAARLSPMGLGNDQGGSIRIPSAFCGIYGFKPTAERSTIYGISHYSGGFDGQIINKACSGPMTKSMDDLILMFKALSDPTIYKQFNLSEIDPNLTIIPIDENALQNNSKKRRFGYFKTLDVIDACSASQRAVDMSIEVLRNQGHEVIEVEIPLQSELVSGFLQNAFSDDLQSLTDILQGESFIDEYKMLDILSTFPNGLKRGLASLLGCLGEKRLKEHILAFQNLNSVEYKRVVYQILELRKQVIKVFDDNKIEAIVCPALATPALDHGKSGDVSDIVAFAFIWNILDFPCGVIPVTKVKEDEQNYDDAVIKDSISKAINKLMKNKTEGLPIGIQVVAPPFKEEVCLNVMKLIDSGIQFYKNNSFPSLEGEETEVDVVQQA